MAPAARPGVTVWFTGLPRSGKTTLSRLVTDDLRARGAHVVLLDGDVIRRTFSAGLGYSKADRDENVRRIAKHARELTASGVICVVAAISPYADARTRAREAIGEFVEVHCAATVEVCAARDTTGLYERAFAGELEGFTGVSDPYEVPESPDLRLDTAAGDPQELAGRILAELEARGYLPAAG